MPHATTDITIESSDEALVAAYLETRDKGLFEELYSRYSGKIYGRCVSLLQDETLAQDAVQDVFLKIITNLSKFSEKSRFSTWVYSITYNWCIDIIRKRKKTSNLNAPEQIEDLDVVEEVEDSFLLETEVSRLKVVLEKIPRDDKAILLMKYLEEMSIKEITDVIGKSESAIKMKIKRAKHRFQLTYKEYFKDM